QRFDTPTIGITTLKALISGEHKGGVIAIGANETMVIDQEEIVQFADEHNICIVVVDPNSEQ
ncbi:MAG TPA: UDP-2,3-diacylglucosamine diphosphatase LpxI, partial [Candidatus Melainabacteria bacterium]|nr:UDP-2,3-diacylglucosamine diphosphatase LpxI [Candidatus Melainabacteria bacterium]